MEEVYIYIYSIYHDGADVAVVAAAWWAVVELSLDVVQELAIQNGRVIHQTLHLSTMASNFTFILEVVRRALYDIGLHGYL
jgi:hypothetical protein